MTKVLIAYPHDIWSLGMEAILLDCGCEVAGRWKDAGEALAAADAHSANLLVVAKDLVDQAHAENAKSPCDRIFPGKIVVVLDPGAELSAKEFVTWDVEGLILSSASAEEFADCIVSVEHGRQWLDPGVRRVLENVGRRMPDCSELSDREMEVAKLAATGLSNKKIAQLLHVSDGTIKMHMHHILTKLHLASRYELIWSLGDTLQPAQSGHANGKTASQDGAAASSFGQANGSSSNGIGHR